MSILLDALKKSESQRILGQTPGIHTNVDAPLADARTGQQWIPLSMLALSAVAIAWFGWQQYREPPLPSSSPPAASSEHAALSTSENGEIAAAGENSAVEGSPLEAYKEDGDNKENTAAASTAGSQEVDARKKSLNQSFTNYEAQDVAEPTRAKPKRPPSITKNRRAVATVDLPPGKESETKTETATPARPSSRVEPVEPEPISFWQVPQALRDGLPEMRITVLVYAEAAEDRFLLINGQRMVEKEELAPGVVLEQIRRDGAVFSYRKYRFLVKG